MGAVFGLFRMAFVCSALLIVVNTINNQFELIPKEDINKSILYGPVSDLVPILSSESNRGEQILKDAKDAINNAEENIIP